MKKSLFGTREWASTNVNCTKGCRNNCKYCYAKFNAVKRYKNIKEEDWIKEIPITGIINKKFKKFDGIVMFPTQHDISENNLEDCLKTINNLLIADNKILIVSKPRIKCIKQICDTYKQYKKNILFRFTIGASNNEILSFWEPNAPSFEERMESLKYAYENGFNTSISMEPCLDWTNVIENFNIMEKYVTHSIWIGTMNFIDQRVEVKTEKDKQMIENIKKSMNQENLQKTFENLKNNPKVKWKETLKKILNLPESTTPENEF